MPLANIRLSPHLNGGSRTKEYATLIATLKNDLPAIVAEALDVPDEEDGRLVATDIALDIVAYSPENANRQDIEIGINAMYFNDRGLNLSARTKQIYDNLRPLIPENRSLSVWVTLSVAGWACDPPPPPQA